MCVPYARYRRGKKIAKGVDAFDYMEKRTASLPLFVEDLPSNLNPGTCISIRGFVSPDCSRFSINLCGSKNPNSDIALHINPRFSQR
nr:galectin-7-like [Leptinotarsa decemlineata]